MDINHDDDFAAKEAYERSMGVIKAAYLNPPFPLYEAEIDLAPVYITDSEMHDTASNGLERESVVGGLGLGKGKFLTPGERYVHCYSSLKGFSNIDLNEAAECEVRDREGREASISHKISLPLQFSSQVEGLTCKFLGVAVRDYAIAVTHDLPKVDLLIRARGIDLSSVHFRLVKDVNDFLRGSPE